VSDGDSEALIRARGDGGATVEKADAVVEEVKASPQKKGVDFPPGDYRFTGKCMIAVKEGANPVEDLDLKFKIEEGGTISAVAAGDIKYSIAGIFSNGALSLKLIYEDGKEVVLDGDMDGKKEINGTYTSTHPEFGTNGTFVLK
jgi:hypothetical protein